MFAKLSTWLSRGTFVGLRCCVGVYVPIFFAFKIALLGTYGTNLRVGVTVALTRLIFIDYNWFLCNCKQLNFV